MYSAHFTDEGSKAQRGSRIGPQSHSYVRPEVGLKSGTRADGYRLKQSEEQEPAPPKSRLIGVTSASPTKLSMNKRTPILRAGL